MPGKRIRRRPVAAAAAASPAVAYQPSDLSIQDTVDKGKGVFTSTAIPPGTCIISEKPLVVFPARHTAAHAPAVVAGCSEEDRRKVMAFGYSPVYTDLNPALRIAKTNCVPMPDSKQAGLFETICRVNHDCTPNAQYFWDRRHGEEGER